MLIFCENSVVAPTYMEILSDFKPVLYSQKDTLLPELRPTNFLIIDENIALCEELSKKQDSPAFLLISTQKIDSDEFAVLQKPVSAHILYQRAQLLLNRQERGLLINFSLNGFTFCGQKRTINDIPLTQKQAELIEFLYENKGVVVSKEQILQSVFGYTQAMQTHTLETHIYKLRQKIGDLKAQFIATKDGGYCLGDG